MNIVTVAPNDTIYTISEQTGVPSALILSANGLTDPNRLSVGQAILVPQIAQTYTVKEGDTLSAIAAENGTTVRTLLQNNPTLGGIPTVYAGQTLILSYATQKSETFAVNGYTYPFIEPAVLAKTLPYLTYLTVFTYGFDTVGNLIAPDDAVVLAMAKDYGTTPILLLSTYTEEGFFNNNLTKLLFENTQLQERLLTQLAMVMREKGYGGVDFDFEYIFADDAQGYVDFIRRATAYLNPLGFFVVTSLASKTSPDMPGLLYEGHNYAALGDASDAIALMTYEWGYTYGPPMAVAPLPNVERVVQYAVSEISPGKILLGEPNYGYDWKLPFVAGESKAQSLSNVQALQLALQVQAQIQYDERAQSPFFTYYDATGSQHEVWFSDARSVAASLALTSQYGLRGIGIWNIMRYFPQLYSVLTENYNIL